MRIRLMGNNSENQHVAGIGEMEPGAWYELDEDETARFLAVQGLEDVNEIGAPFELDPPVTKPEPEPEPEESDEEEDGE